MPIPGDVIDRQQDPVGVESAQAEKASLSPNFAIETSAGSLISELFDLKFPPAATTETCNDVGPCSMAVALFNDDSSEFIFWLSEISANCASYWLTYYRLSNLGFRNVVNMPPAPSGRTHARERYICTRRATIERSAWNRQPSRDACV